MYFELSQNGQYSICIRFDIIDPSYEVFNDFRLNNKRLYGNQRDLIIQDNNNILNLDNEQYIIPSILHQKMKYPDYNSVDEFRDELKESFLNDYIRNIITKYVDDNYNCDIEGNKTHRDKIVSLQFDNTHAKFFLYVAKHYNLLVPLIVDFTNTFIVDNMTEYLLSFMEMIIEYYEQIYGINVHNKLYETINSRVKLTKYSDQVYWKAAEINAVTPESFLVTTLEKMLIDLIPKFIFDQSIINLIHVYIVNNIKFLTGSEFKVTYMTLSGIDGSSPDEEVSAFEKADIMNSKIDESKNIIVDYQITKMISSHSNLFTNDEVDYYMDKVNTSKDVLKILSAFYKSSDIVYGCTRRQLTKLALIVRNTLLQEGYIFIPYILFGKKIPVARNVLKKVNMKILENNKYQLALDKYKSLGSMLIDNNFIIEFVNTINGNYEFMMMGETDTFTTDSIADIIKIDETLNFILRI